MKTSLAGKFWVSFILMPLLFITPEAFAQDEPSACVVMGALAYDNWSKTDSGGSGMPAGEADNDYVRCKACHGWDRMATEGGYVRRSRNAGRANAGAGDGDMTSRVISPFMGVADMVTAAMILHSGTGRSWADGTGSWVPLDAMHSAANKAANSQGFTLGNQHPDFSTDGANMGDIVLTQEQLDCLVEFLNLEDADPSAYFSNINPDMDPVLYTIIDTADAAAGETFYNDNCDACHDDPAGESGVGAPEGGILAYLAKDGKFSEFVHKSRWGIPDTDMTRDAIGSPTSADLANMMLWLQELGASGFAINSGLSGHWWNGEDRSGEGFMFDVSYDQNGDLFMFVSFYAHDPDSKQVWMFAQNVVEAGSTTAVLDVYLPVGGTWGAEMDPDDVDRVLVGTLTLDIPGCLDGSMALDINEDGEAAGFTDVAYDIKRDLLTPDIACPTPTAD